MTTERGLEVRCAAHAVELRASDKGIGQLTGYAAVFNRHSQNLGGFVEQVDPAAFTKSLADAVPVMARGNHDDAYLLGTTWAGTLTLEVDGTGLRYTVDLPDTNAGRDFKVLAERGDIKWSSFAFRTIEDEWSQTDQGFPLRTLRAVQLVDVAPVNSPAYLDTSVAARSLAERAAETEVEQVEEQRETHSPIRLMKRRMDLDASK
jgi:uncharacterized protein